ncbi:polyketide synthesis cyclase [Micromonospora violae]|uniref:Polyketide synthesis cyclase n=1 Tax=Micromonospora violae TaxID=1278207 RepID=A0A4Q7UE92_9ACTN|nr:polyketide synthesis cyclase [Micromonospora violae]
MSRLLIVSRIIPGAEGRVAQIFAESDATELPSLTGVTHRSLYCLHDLCVHLLETSDDIDPDALAAARNHPLFQQVNERLSAHTSPYLPTWRSPRDAIAGCFYRWDAATAPVTRPASTTAPVARPASTDAPVAHPASTDAPAAHSAG